MSDKIYEIENLEIKYNYNDIKNIYFSSIRIHNIGNTVIKKQDVIPTYPIAITTSGLFLESKNNKIFDLTLDKKTNYGLSYINSNFIEIEFDYIPKHAIIGLDIFHTGNINFCGDLIDGKIINRKELHRKKQIITHIIWILFFITIIVILYLNHIHLWKSYFIATFSLYSVLIFANHYI